MMDSRDEALAASRRPSIDTGAAHDPLLHLAYEALEEANSTDASLHRSHGDHSDVPQQAWLNIPGDTLNFSHQDATTISLQVIELIKDRVERLALSHNSRIRLPDELSMCSRLFYLNLRWNDFTSFPESILLLTNLQTLDLSHNALTSIPDDLSRMTSLKFLAFTDNHVTRLPVCMGDMTSLTRLKMEGNPVEFPPSEEYEPTPEAQKRTGYEPNTYICAQVKRFMRREKEREREREKERQRLASESEMSESNLETPRPLRRTNTGRFPVRPSGGNPQKHRANGSVGSANGDTRSIPDPPRFNAPHLAQRPLANDLVIPPVRRPGASPLTMHDSNSNRSRSETIAASGPRLKRHGFVPSRKTSGPPSATFLNHQTTRPTHLRTASYAGTDDDDTGRSSTMSPADTALRRPWVSRARLSSLPEDRRISKITSPTIRSARLLVYSLDQLNRPLDDVVRVIRTESSRPSTAERLHVNAIQILRELDAQLHILTPLTEHQSPDTKDVRQILKRSRYCVQAYHQVVSELRLKSRDLIIRGDPMYLRALMLQIFACLVEVRNACAIQEAVVPPPRSSRFSNISQARSDHTVTPTQPRSTPKPLRGARIMAGMREKSPPAGHYSSSLWSSTSSRNTTMSTVSVATPRSGDSSFDPTPASIHSNITSSPFIDSEEERQFEKLYMSLKIVCEIADHTLFSCRQDLFVRKEGAARNMSSTAARAWSMALTKCDALMHAFENLKKKMGKVRLNDPAKGKRKDLRFACDGVFNAWYDMASEMKNLGTQGLDISSVKVPLRSLQKAIKDASRVVASLTTPRQPYDSRSPVGNGANVLQNLPPTPLSAALGPAAQATVPNTPGLSSGFSSPAESWFNHQPDGGERVERERSNTVNSRYGNTLRAR